MTRRGLALTVGVALGALAAAALARAARTGIEDRNGAAAGAPQERGNAERRTRAGLIKGARAIAGGVRANSARDSLQSIARYSLQLARNRLARQQSDASQALKEARNGESIPW